MNYDACLVLYMVRDQPTFCVSTDNASSIYFAEEVICCKYRWLQSIINPDVRLFWLSVDAKNLVEESCWS